MKTSGREVKSIEEMESDLGKLFIGGISWDTNEDRLREYFKTYGEVVEAVIMKDRTTGRARGFGFVVFADPAVAERVVMDKHVIDGRTVEAKKAVPRDDQHILNRNNSSLHGSPSPARTKKIFVGGLASTVTESDFKKYFDQFGTTTDVVVMYDHNTQRPRGFGFITYDSEDAVEKVLLNSFHELNGKMVEVKRAVPKELSPGPMRSPLNMYGNYGLNRVNNFLNGYTQGYNPGSIGGYGMRMDARFGPITSGARSGFTPFGSSAYGMGMNFETGLNSSYGGSAGFNNSVGYGRGLGPYYGGSSNRYAAPTPIGYGGNSGGTGSLFSSTSRNVWGNGLNYATTSSVSNAYMGSGSGGIGVFSNNGVNWGSSPSISTPGGGSGSGYGGGTGNLGYGSAENNYGVGGGGYNRSSGTGAAPSSYAASSGGHEGAYADLYSGSSVYGDPTWRSGTSEIDGSGAFSYGLGNTATDVTAKSSAGYMSGYNSSNRQPNRGKALSPDLFVDI
ncbi:Heterogeneous nuclear ribonucleoprotein 1 [Acorus calamus]|uniref:Heterogeneous nuclear ribonucleoprotein 1 n=1 Tax=Acorus calamus TaxID=4465 RepID=A0AAV9DY38_ACOCL|nr:Heterogeneous nuclear ribonucleoprotein 1 [Acorus calamus]